MNKKFDEIGEELQKLKNQLIEKDKEIYEIRGSLNEKNEMLKKILFKI